MVCSARSFDFNLEHKEGRSITQFRSSSRIHPFTPTIMQTSSRVLRINISDGTVEIPASAFTPLGEEVRERFNVQLRVHKHQAGVNHGEFVPFDHYLVELAADSHEQIEEAIAAIDDRIDALVERYTQSNTAVPAGR
jgi:hypothetical protein